MPSSVLVGLGQLFNADPKRHKNPCCDFNTTVHINVLRKNSVAQLQIINTEEVSSELYDSIFVVLIFF